jgi:hypothetical protein
MARHTCPLGANRLVFQDQIFGYHEYHTQKLLEVPTKLAGTYQAHL